MPVPSRRGVAGFLGALLLGAVPQAFPSGGGEDDCLSAIGYSGDAPKTTLRPASRPGERWPIGICSPENARENTSFPIKTSTDFVPVSGDDKLGFYVVYGVRASTTGGIAGNVGIFLFPLDNGEVLVFGSGYGNIPGANYYDAAYDMARVDEVIRSCLGGSPVTTPLRMVAPHGHGDHVNPACNQELRALGYTILEIAFHQGDALLVNNMSWSAQDRGLFRALAPGADCLDELLSYSSPLGKIWFHSRPGHTDGSLDLVIDVRGDAGNRVVVRGSQPGTTCETVPGTRERLLAHGNAVLSSVPPGLTQVDPPVGTSLGGTSVTLTGLNFAADGAGSPVVLFDGVQATNVAVVSDTQLSCTSPPGPPGQTVTLAVVNNNGLAEGEFSYHARPTLSSLSPTLGDWRGGTTVVLRGTGFLGGGTNEVFFGQRRATNVIVQSDAQLTCRSPQGNPGTQVNVLLRNANGQASLGGAFYYNAQLGITDLEPTSGSALGGTPVQLTGYAFTGTGAAPTVTFGGVPASAVTLLSDTSVACLAPPGAPGASVNVVLTNSVGSTSFSAFRYHASPSLTSVSPGIGRFIGGALVTVSGTGFTLDSAGTNEVRFGGVPAGNVTPLFDGALTCVTPPGVAGDLVDVTLENANGTATLAQAYRYGQPLAGSSLWPASGSALGGTAVTIQGSGFLDGPAGPTSVLFDGVAASQVGALDDRTLQCSAPPGTPGKQVSVQLANENGTVLLPAAYRYHAVPSLSSLSPASGHAGEFTPVTLTGQGFLDDDAGPGFVVFGGISASEVVVLDDTRLVCVAPQGTPGSAVDVILVNQNGMAEKTGGFRYHTAPALGAATPASGAASGGARVTLVGSGFLADQAGTNAVVFGASPGTGVAVINDTTLRVTAPAGSAGTRVDVVVTNRRGSATLPMGFRYHARPTLTGVTPERGTFQGNTQVTLLGSGFQVDNPGASAVLFGGQLATGVVVQSDTELTCSTPPGILDALVDVVLSNQNGAAALPNAFSYAVPAPALVAIAPASGPAAGGGLAQLAGSGFSANSAGANTVLFGASAAAEVSAQDDQTLTCRVPPGVPGSVVELRVTNANGSGELASGYRYHALPTLTSIDPPGASAVGGAEVALLGSGFLTDSAGTNAVLFGGLPAAQVTVVDDGRLTCRVPAGQPGSAVDVVLSNLNGASTPLPFPYHPAPRLTAVEPSFGPASGGTLLTVRGTGFLAEGAGANELRIDGRLARNLVVLSDTALSCEAPRGDAGYATVSLANGNGSSLLPEGYHYGRPPPEVRLLSPASGPGSGNTVVTIQGQGFLDFNAGPNRVKFGAAFATSVLVLDDATLLCLAPSGAEGETVDVALNNNGGTATLPQAFRYHLRPTLAEVSPGQGDPLGGTRLTLTGSGFLADRAGENALFFGNLRARDLRVVDDAHLTCSSPTGAPGATFDVSLRNANGSARLLGAFEIQGGPPALDSIAPAKGPFPGGTLVTLQGRGFQSPRSGALRVLFGETPATEITVLDDRRATCVAPAGEMGRRVTLTIQNKHGAGALVDAYEYKAIAPTLASLSPGHGPAAGGTRVRVRGTGFQAVGAGASEVRFGGTPAANVSVLDDTTLDCDVPPGQPGASVDVRLANENGSDALADAFRYHALPTVLAVAPARGPAAASTAVTLTGSGFLADDAGPNVVTFGGLGAADVVELSDMTLTCIAPPGTAGTSVDVLVANANGVAALAEGFRYHAQPTLSAVTPDHGPASGAGTLTLTGSGFLADDAGPNAVTFGGAPAASVLVLSDTTLRCTPPAGAPGTQVAVALANANGEATLPLGYRYHAGPTLTAVAPTRGPSSGANTVTLTGGGFLVDGAGANAVTFGAAPATDVVVASDTSLTCKAPAGTAGALVAVALTNGNGGVALPDAYRYNARPTLTGVSPSQGSPLGGTAVTLSGTGFSSSSPGPNAVTFGGIPATDVVVVDDATLTCLTPAGAPGASVAVQVANANGSATLAAGFTYSPAPTLASLAPASGPAAAGTAVTLTGSGFGAAGAGATVVTFGGVAGSGVVVLDDAHVSCEAPAGTPGASVDVAVTNENGLAQLAGAFRYHSLPGLTSVSPAQGSSVASTAVTLTGSGFLADLAGPCSVLFGAQPATDVLVTGDATLTCAAPPGAAGTWVDVTVSNANGAASLPAAFGYADPAPTLAGIEPGLGSSLGGTTVTLTGTGFLASGAGENVVTFGGVVSSGVIVLADTALECKSPAGTLGATVDVTLSNANGSATLVAAFRYVAPNPTLASVAPASGPAAGNGTVTLTGSGFTANDAGANTVTFGALSAAGVVTVSDTTLTCQVPPGTAGSVAVRVANTNGSAEVAGGYRYHALPALTSIAPTSGTALGGTLLTVRGSGFLADAPGANAVLLGNKPVTALTVVDDTTLTCRAPSGGGGAVVGLSLSNHNGAAQLPSVYRYHTRPTLAAVTPASGPSTGGTRLTLTGAGFRVDGAVVNIVSIGGVVASAVSVLSDTTIECNAPAGTAGLAVQVSVANVNGTALLAGGFRYHARPTVTAVLPVGGPAAGGTPVTLTGSGFLVDAAGTNAVLLGGSPATDVSVIDDTTLACTTPAGVEGTLVDVVVTNANGSGTLASGFQYEVPIPVLASLDPPKGSTHGSTLVTIRGSGFDPIFGASASFGGASASQVTVVDESTLTCLTPPSALGRWVDVSVSLGTATARRLQGFQYVAPPTLVAVDPGVGVPEGGAVVTLSGSGFLVDGAGLNTVSFAGIPAAGVGVLSDGLLVCEVPAGPALSDAEIVVRNENGEARLAAGFRWQRELATDLNRDGRGDLIVAASGHDALADDAGGVHVFFGSELPLLDRSSGDADVTAIPEATGSAFGAPVATGDLDGDGVPELLVGAPQDDGSGLDAGAVYVFPGPFEASAVPLRASLASIVLRGPAAGERFGSALAVHDLNRDGRLDLAIGAPAGSLEKVYVYFGAAGFSSATAPVARILSTRTGSGFGSSLAAGDLDGDAWPDLVVGSPRGRTSGLTTGVVGIVRGGPGSFAGDVSGAWIEFSGERHGDRFGTSLAVGDFTGDAFDDLVVGAPLSARLGALSGVAYVFLGRADLAGSSALAASAILDAESSGDRFGSALAAGDVDGDGRDDLLVGAPEQDGAGRAYLFLGRPALAHTSALEADAHLYPEPDSSGDLFGATVALVDVDGNALEDLIVTAPLFDGPESDLGRVYVFSASALGTASHAAASDGTLTGTVSGDHLGQATASDH